MIYVFVDFEMNMIDSEYKKEKKICKSEIIEIGAVKLDEDYNENDKMIDAMKAFDEIINNMPESEKAFNLAKDALITRLRTERITKSDVLWSYLNAQDLGLNTDSRKELFEKAQTMTLPEIKAFQEKWVKGRTYIYCVLGDEKDLDLKGLSQYGPIQKLTQEELFGY